MFLTVSPVKQKWNQRAGVPMTSRCAILWIQYSGSRRGSQSDTSLSPANLQPKPPPRLDHSHQQEESTGGEQGRTTGDMPACPTSGSARRMARASPSPVYRAPESPDALSGINITAPRRGRIRLSAMAAGFGPSPTYWRNCIHGARRGSEISGKESLHLRWLRSGQQWSPFRCLNLLN